MTSLSGFTKEGNPDEDQNTFLKRMRLEWSNLGEEGRRSFQRKAFLQKQQVPEEEKAAYLRRVCSELQNLADFMKQLGWTFYFKISAGSLIAESSSAPAATTMTTAPAATTTTTTTTDPKQTYEFKRNLRRQVKPWEIKKISHINGRDINPEVDVLGMPHGIPFKEPFSYGLSSLQAMVDNGSQTKWTSEPVMPATSENTSGNVRGLWDEFTAGIFSQPEGGDHGLALSPDQGGDTAVHSSEQPCLTPTVSPATCTTRHPAVATRLQPLFASRVQQNVCRALLPVIIYIVFMIVLGTVGNSVALVVYYKRFKPSSTRTFIMSLSAISLLASLVCFPEKIAEYCLHFTFTNRSACQVFSFLRGFTTYSMGLTHTAMAFDRQRRVCSPSVRQWKMQDIYIAVGMCVALSVFISIPMYVLYGSRTVDWTSNVTGVMCGEDDSYVRTTGLILYYVVLKGVFVTGMVVIVISYVKVGLKVWEHKKQLEKRYLATSSCRHQARDRDRESFQVPAMSQLEVTRTDNNITHGDRCSTSCDLDCTGRNLTSFEINSTFSCGDRAECHVTGKLYDVTSFDHVVPNPPCDCLKLVTFTPPSVAHSSALSQPSRRTLRYLCSMKYA
ncbi:hypothetical protein C0Q70_07228 [Pomacea canaliculata]|uniref:G-protein coupled receptors family 1 profile domain-containing protein n=1 Tax=Pomacea canaliculata TaxID=400727 RepID=A0A2T7PEG7_POMCA|nr:hypothetical protein C0Q70_07228 [Pomacea canaliculata]